MRYSVRGFAELVHPYREELFLVRKSSRAAA
jgi:hypothetical protein